MTVEEAPVEILTATALYQTVKRVPHPSPERGRVRWTPSFIPRTTISQHDFDGWVQERGLYFMSTWDEHYQPLLSCHDPGEQPLRGGLLVAHYGKGTYIYTGYAFFRQLPFGVPGAVRLFVNLVSAGHER